MPKLNSQRRRWTLKRVLSSATLLVAALLLLAFTEQAGGLVGQAALFVCAAACAVTALWPHYGLALVLAGIMALSFDKKHLDAASAWNITFLILAAPGMGHLLRRWRFLAWIGVSFPFWAMSKAVPFLMYIALGLVFAGMVLTAVSPLLSRTRRTGVTPLPQLAQGPLVDVPPRIFRFQRGIGVLKAIAALCGLAFLAGCILWSAGFRQEGIVLALTSGILGLSFGFSLWFTIRLYLRIDARGIHSRVIWGEKSIPWNELGNLSLRYVCFPGLALNYVYYRVLSPSKEISFPNSMTGADELRELIEKASGMRWPVPEITPTPQ